MSKVAGTATFAHECRKLTVLLRLFALARFWCLVFAAVVPSEAVLRNIVWGG